MNLGVLEALLLRQLRAALGEGIEWRRGPPVSGAVSGLLPEVFVHAARLLDDAEPARHACPGGWGETGPVHIELELSCVCGQHAQAQQLAGLLAAPALQVLNRLGELPLTPGGELRLQARPLARLARCETQPADGPTAQVRLGIRLSGLLRADLRGDEDLLDAHAGALRLDIEADPAGIDIKAERVRLLLAADEPALDLSGWQLRDAAGHHFVFPPATRLAHELSLWTRRGKPDAANLFWGRRKPVWNNAGDVALLLDAAGAERARASWQPPLPAIKSRRR